MNSGIQIGADGLYFNPYDVEKQHLCESCWMAVDEFIKRGPSKSS